ncbi:MAG: CarD family transcriptional regulator [Lachnospiraceae bacterium]|nr:CarD family transcriptional regulator [Lachnospiraceae bacterium]
MFQEKEMIVYGSHGICEVEHIGRLNMPMVDPNKLYYTLQPKREKASHIYAPVENNKTIMRKLLTKEEAKELLGHVAKLDTLWITNDRERESCYKEAIRSCDCEELIRIIKTLYLRKQKRVEDGKKPTAIDERYFHQAEEQLYGELSFVLKLDKEEIRKQICWE